MLPDDGSTSFNKDNSANFFLVNEKKYNEAFRGVLLGSFSNDDGDGNENV